MQILVVIVILIFVLAVFGKNRNNKDEIEENEKKQRKVDRMNELRLEIQKYNDKIITSNIIEIVRIPKDLRFKSAFYHVWKEGNSLLFYPADIEENLLNFDIENLKVIKVSLSAIDYYSSRVLKTELIKTSGGTVSGGGSNFGKAVVGGIIAGAPGAIIASRESIKSDPLKIDKELVIENELFMNYIDDKKINRTLFFNYTNISVFNKIVPEMNYNNMINKAVVYKSKEEGESDIEKRLKQLIDLHQKGLISDADFEYKNKELLENI